MIGTRIVKAAFCVGKRQIVPKPPKLLSGELEPFRMEAQNQQLYDGYSLDQLYGSKYGASYPPAVRAEMTKDNIAASLIVVVGLGIIFHLNNLFNRELDEIKGVQAAKFTRKVQLA